MKKKLIGLSMKKIVYGLLIIAGILTIYLMKADDFIVTKENVYNQEDARVSDGKMFVEDGSTASQAKIDKIYKKATHLSNALRSSSELPPKTYKRIDKHLEIAILELKRAIELVKNAHD